MLAAQLAILTLRFSPSDGRALRIETLQESEDLYEPGAASRAEPGWEAAHGII